MVEFITFLGKHLYMMNFAYKAPKGRASIYNLPQNTFLLAQIEENKVINFIFRNLSYTNLEAMLKQIKKFKFQTLKVKLWRKKRNFRAIRQRRTTNLTRGAGLLGLS